ncbi:YheC/YheD family protein [Rossellomorea aquimaris]|uniref:YheC/YheD family endospore coat-associated protein n=1 Tax=Rossellomorea aquimaris TaxID=189382 RepID=UPI001CD6C656|nr:YheC/YheD family protein [Rossellomorea aquimaris]MCA1056495.1 YheC/YheD family protein [Rossellomorea aquimaris]
MDHSLGIMTLNPDPSHPYFNEIGRHSVPRKVELSLFSPLSISPDHETVEGFVYNKSACTWKPEVFDIPEFIYDRTYYDKSIQSRQAKLVVQWMKNLPHIRFLGYGLPNKWRLYEKLKESPLAPYIPETFLVENNVHLLNLLSSHKDIIMKPVDGAHGFAVYHITCFDGKVTVRTTKKRRISSQGFESSATFLRWADRLLGRHTFIVQERISNRTERETPFDLRVLMNKDQYGEWREFQRAIREGTEGGILTNISRGGSYFPQDEWKKGQSNTDWDGIEAELNDILEQLPYLLEASFSPLFELGIDILIASDHSLWILDINSKPGHKIVEALAHEKLGTLYQTPLEYCEYLSSESIASLRRGDF